MNITGVLIGAFFIAHGLVHILYRIKPPDEKWPFSLSYSWLLTRLGLKEGTLRRLGTVLWVSAMAGFILGALGIFGTPLLKEVWRPMAATSSIISIILIGLFWHKNFIYATLINVGIFITIVLVKWPSIATIGW